MVGIDTNILVRFLVQDDEVLAQKADMLVGGLRSGAAVLDRVILAELGYVLHSVYGFNKQDVSDVYSALLSDGRFNIPDRELVQRTVELFAGNKPLSFEDCWLLALCQAKDITSIITFDKALLKATDSGSNDSLDSGSSPE